MDLKTRNENALDNFCGAGDFVASGIQFARGRRPDSPASGCGAGGLGHQPGERATGHLNLLSAASEILGVGPKLDGPIKNALPLLR